MYSNVAITLLFLRPRSILLTYVVFFYCAYQPHVHNSIRFLRFFQNLFRSRGFKPTGGTYLTFAIIFFASSSRRRRPPPLPHSLYMYKDSQPALAVKSHVSVAFYGLSICSSGLLARRFSLLPFRPRNILRAFCRVALNFRIATDDVILRNSRKSRSIIHYV